MRQRRILVLLVVVLASAAMSAFAAGNVTLQAWINDFTPESKSYVTDTVIPTFEKANPGIDVEMQFVGWGSHSEKYLTAWAGGDVPDIYEPAVEQVAEMVAKGQALVLDKYVTAWGQIGDFYPAAYQPYMVNNHYYGIPWRMDIRSIYYRKDLLQQAGFTKGPDTWDDLMKMAPKLTKRDGNVVTQQGFNVEFGNFGAQEFVEFVWQNGGELLNAAQDKAQLTSPEVVQALTFLTNLYKAEQPGGAQLPQSPIPYFAIGQRALEYGNNATLLNVMKYAPDKLDQVGVVAPLMNKKRVNNVFGGTFSISTRSKNADQAWKFISYFTSAEVQAKYNELAGLMPARKAAMATPYFQTPIMKTIFDHAQYGKIYLIIPAWWEMLTALGDQLEQSYTGKKTPQQALQAAQDQWTAILARGK